MTTEEHTVPGEKLVERVKELIKEGNARRVIVKNGEGGTLMEIPLTMGVVGAVMIPVWVALGAIAALAGHYTIAIERQDERVDPKGELR
ncbi:MAG: DUF4342 domain-containing protein [Gemmatimonadota bacterium]